MLGLGKQVLQKIENLLVQIDKKKVKNKDKNDHNLSRSKSKQKINQQNQKNYKQAPQKSHRKQQLSVHQQDDKQNICSHRIQQLYLNHFVKQKRMLDRNLSNLQQEMKKLKNFKVQNKTSQFYIQKQMLKPIHDRTLQIIRKKQKSIQKLKEQLPKTRQQLQQQQALAIIQENKKKHPKLTKQELKKLLEQMEQRNLLRMEKSQKRKLNNLSQKSVIFLQKPSLISTNNVWWQKKRLKKKLSTNVLQRFSQYNIEKKNKWQKYLEIRKQQETPFAPRLSEATRQIARKTMSRRSLFENIPRSHSCRALSKRQDLSFLQRRSGQQTERSLSRNLTHQKSATTMNTSGNATIQRRFI